MRDDRNQQQHNAFQRGLTRRRFLQKTAAIGAAGAAVGGGLFSIRSAYADGISVAADFAVQSSPALVKSKFGVFNSSLVGLDRYQRDTSKLAALSANALRFDGGLWGFNFNQSLVQGVGSYNFSETDQLISLLSGQGVKPYWSYEYEPPPLQPSGGTYQSPPNSLTNWATVLGDLATHFKNGHPVGYHEIWNEPDLGTTFWTGSQADYNNLYQSGVTALRAADPQALVGGPALAIAPGWADEFLSFVTSNQLPLDYFSFHHYGTDYDSALQAMQGAKANYGLSATPIHLNEYNPYTNRTNDTTSPCDHYPAAAQLLADFNNFLNYPYLGMVMWAQFMDPGDGYEHIGLVSTDGHLKAAYNGWVVYARMPANRSQVTVNGSLQAMASTDGTLASLVVWNQSGADQSASVQLNNLPFSSGSLAVYRIDGTYSSYYDNAQYEALTQTESHADISSGWTWSGTVPNNGVVYFEAQAGSSGSPTPTPTQTPTPTPTPTQTPSPTPTPAGGVAVNYTVTNQWTGEFTTSVVISNNGSTDINGWTLQFTFSAGQTLAGGWAATWSQQGSQVTATSTGTIAAGQSFTTGFIGYWSGSNPSPTAFLFNGSPVA